MLNFFFEQQNYYFVLKLVQHIYFSLKENGKFSDNDLCD